MDVEEPMKASLMDSNSMINIYISLYYKERRQLETFLTQFRPALPLTPDPPARLHDDQKDGTNIKITISGVFLPKNIMFFSREA
jgi:hypothetical protein